MKITIIKKVTKELKYLNVYLPQDYWDGADISFDNGDTWEELEEDGDKLIPDELFINANNIIITNPSNMYFIERNVYRKIFHMCINIDSGQVINWPKNLCMKLYWKIVDEGLYQYMGDDEEIIYEIYDYVPDELAIEDGGYGDYVIMNINGDGQIEHWNKNKVGDTIDNIMR